MQETVKYYIFKIRLDNLHTGADISVTCLKYVVYIYVQYVHVLLDICKNIDIWSQIPL